MNEGPSSPDLPLPGIEIFDLSESATGGEVKVWLGKLLEDVVKRCLDSPGSRTVPLLPQLESIEVSLVTDAAIAEVHGRFMEDPTPTDVITFQHGEILISLETAERSAAALGHPARREALLYLIHGLLHLNGFNDTTQEARAEMETVQFEILDAIWPFPEAKNPG